ncbi:hypothetical protein C8R44DRAFT_820559 [Mycena epipterygia]|nr:hypothetical protein C8R44DRAFT_820559 [Mycena epipterygia]
MSTWIHDPRPPPEYPYTRATSSHSAVVQIYGRSGQLPTAELVTQRSNLGSDLCRFGCEEIESPHHLFVQCPRTAHVLRCGERERRARLNLSRCHHWLAENLKRLCSDRERRV